MKIVKYIFIILLFSYSNSLLSQNENKSLLKLVKATDVYSGSQSTEEYFPLIKEKKIALVSNHTSRINQIHLVDSLLSAGFNVTTLFCPEHGFRGEEEAGKNINNSKDSKTGIPLISLYGKRRKPTEKDMQDIDIVLFDIQDVGVRYYSYISTLTYVMESCAENDIPLIVLDKPNPNGFYIDGPVLQKEYTSFVGLHPVPIVYGMTIGEYALMVNGEKWLNNEIQCELTVIKNRDYDHNMIVKLSHKPSPNLPNWFAVYLYPSLALFEGTIMSVGRGTDEAFQIFGHPDYALGFFIFKPESKPGAKNPKYDGQVCYGQNLISYALNYKSNPRSLNLNWILESYRYFGHNGGFFNNYFNTLVGNKSLQAHIRERKKEDEIRSYWENNLNEFKKIRAKYLLYPDITE